MINLIPKEERKKNHKSFYYKIIVLFLFFMGFFVFVFFIAILPSYFLSFTKVNLINTKLKNQKVEPTPLLNKETALMVKDLNFKLGIIEKTQNNKFTFSQKILNSIILKKITEIKITEISYGNNSSGRTVKISGTAPSREILLSFRRALEDDVAFKQVDLPISNFVRGSNIRFNLSLIPS